MHPKLQIAAWTAFTLAVLAWIVFWLVPFASKSNDLSKADKADRVTFNCDRGFHTADWKSARLQTGQSVAKCDWLDGKSRAQVAQALGAADKTKGTAASQWTFDSRNGNVTGATSQTLRI